jgi:hypothetical protein
LALKYAIDEDVLGAILLSPPLHRTTDEELTRWRDSDKKLVGLIPQFDDYLTPDQAKVRFAMLPKIELVGVEGAKHLWVGEAATKRVLDEIVRVVNPTRYPLAETFRL